MRRGFYASRAQATSTSQARSSPRPAKQVGKSEGRTPLPLTGEEHESCEFP
jgi:hypothetical protein